MNTTTQQVAEALPLLQAAHPLDIVAYIVAAVLANAVGYMYMTRRESKAYRKKAEAMDKHDSKVEFVILNTTKGDTK